MGNEWEGLCACVCVYMHTVVNNSGIDNYNNNYKTMLINYNMKSHSAHHSLVQIDNCTHILPINSLRTRHQQKKHNCNQLCLRRYYSTTRQLPSFIIELLAFKGFWSPLHMLKRCLQAYSDNVTLTLGHYNMSATARFEPNNVLLSTIRTPPYVRHYSGTSTL